MKKNFRTSALLLAVVLLAGAGCANTAPKPAMEKTDGPGAMMDAQKEAAPNDAAAMKKPGTMAPEKDTMQQQTTDSPNAMQSDAMAKGVYQDFSPDLMASAKTGKVVLFFKASWCPTCKQVDDDILSHLQEIPNGVSILKVNYDDATELKRKYGVTYQHTFVQVDERGTLIKKWSGSPTLKSLLSSLNE